MARKDERHYIRYIDNITILTNVGEEVTLPNPIVAHLEDGSLQEVWVQWEDKPIDVSEEIELVYKGKVEGYPIEVLCSIQVGRQTDNPASSFPECIDQFGIPKRDIQSEDVPHIDDYQYFKAKIPRTLAEEYHLKYLRELVGDQVILARDINHLRNAVIEIEKYIWVVQDQLDDLFDRVNKLEVDMEWVLDNLVIDAKNVGDGMGLFLEKKDRILHFKTLEGKNINIEDTGDTLMLQARDYGAGVCGINTVAKSFKTCHADNRLPVTVADGMVSYSDYFNWQMIKMKNRSGSAGAPDYPSLLGFFGMGIRMPIDTQGWDGTGTPPSHGKQSCLYAGRFFKGNTDLIFEIKTAPSEYTGFIIGQSNNKPHHTTGKTYSNGIYRENISLIQTEVAEPTDIYSTDVKATSRAIRLGYGNDHDFDPNNPPEDILDDIMQ